MSRDWPKKEDVPQIDPKSIIPKFCIKIEPRYLVDDKGNKIKLTDFLEKSKK